MTVREWIEEEVYKAIEAEEEQHGRNFAESDKRVYAEELINECVDGWDAGDDPNEDDEGTRFMRDRTIDYIEERAEDIVEDLSVREDEA